MKEEKETKGKEQQRKSKTQQEFPLYSLFLSYRYHPSQPTGKKEGNQIATTT